MYDVVILPLLSITTLFLDLASNTRLIALVRDDRMIASASIDSTTGEGQLLPLIESMLSKGKITFKDLDRIASTTGPGGFMSLRVGIALANALSDSLKIPLAGVHLSDLWAARLPSSLAPPPKGEGKQKFGVLWVHSTKKEFVFVRSFGADAKHWREPTLEKIDDLKNVILDRTPYVGELIESQQASLPQLKKAEHPKSVEEVLPELLETLTYEMKSLSPWYGRGA